MDEKGMNNIGADLNVSEDNPKACTNKKGINDINNELNSAVVGSRNFMNEKGMNNIGADLNVSGDNPKACTIKKGINDINNDLNSAVVDSMSFMNEKGMNNVGAELNVSEDNLKACTIEEGINNVDVNLYSTIENPNNFTKGYKNKLNIDLNAKVDNSKTFKKVKGKNNKEPGLKSLIRNNDDFTIESKNFRIRLTQSQKEQIKQNIEYDVLLEKPITRNFAENILNIIFDTYEYSGRTPINANGKTFQTEEIQKIIFSLNHEQIELICENYNDLIHKKGIDNIKNKRAYLRSMILNAKKDYDNMICSLNAEFVK